MLGFVLGGIACGLGALICGFGAVGVSQTRKDERSDATEFLVKQLTAGAWTLGGMFVIFMLLIGFTEVFTPEVESTPTAVEAKK